jgi:ferredoxin
VLLGGAAGTFVGPEHLETPLTFEGTRAIGATLGSGVVMVFDDGVDLRDILLRIAAFFVDESCGQCVPCRVGTVRQEEALRRLLGGNCIGVCPTGARMFTSEHDLRQAGAWDEAWWSVTETICPYRGVGCTLALLVQGNAIVQVTSPLDCDVTRGHRCIKGRFGWQFVQRRAPGDGT